MKTSAFVILGNHLFRPSELEKAVRGKPLIFMAEDEGLCTHFKYHQQKIVLFLAAMREQRRALEKAGFEICYYRLDDEAYAQKSYEDKLLHFIKEHKIADLHFYEVEDKFFEKRIFTFCEKYKLPITVHPNPMFLTSRSQLSDYLKRGKRPFMKTFYEIQRTRLGILVDRRLQPVGGRWSFDTENRRKLPKTVEPPPLRPWKKSAVTMEVVELVEKKFASHPGKAAEFWLPTTHGGAQKWLRHFLEERFFLFGEYEDAITSKHEVIYHSVLTPLLNLGLITPQEVVEEALQFAAEKKINLNSLEGFIRQVIGWREFIRGIYQNFSEREEKENFFGHHRKLKECWYTGTTGIDPLDDVIKKAQRLGWTHHIERLMIASNIMLLSEIHPHETYRWFMEMYVDSSDWVMGPNVFGMGQFSDGGIFATKPYICGSNYILKMSDYQKGPWCEVMDGLYWSFIHKHKSVFAKNARMANMVFGLDRIKPERKEHLFKIAEDFKARVSVG